MASLQYKLEFEKGFPHDTQIKEETEGELGLSSEGNDYQQVLILNRNNKESITLVKDWTDEEERKLLWKVDLVVMPILWLGFFALQMDRGNLGNAKTSTLLEDLHMTQNQFNVGLQIMSTGIVVFEIPSNVILQKIGARYWLSAQIFLWSIVAIFQSFSTNYSQYVGTRLLLGVFESGYIPGSLYIISVWWKRSELSLRHSIFFTGNLVATAVCPLISAAILRDLTGARDWSGWRWLFSIEGLVSFFIAIFYFFTIPESPNNPSPFWSKKIKYFNDRERHILSTRILLDDPNKFIATKNILFNDIKEAFLEWRIWIHWTITIINTQATTVISTYTPSLIQSFGFDVFKSNAYSSIGGWILIVAVLISSYISDKKGHRGLLILLSCIWQSALSIALRAMPHDYPKNKKFAIITLYNCFTVQHVLNTSWLSINIKSPVTRNIAMAIIIMGANTGGITGGQILRGGDAPYYPKGFTALLVCQIIVTIVVALNTIQYYYSNKHLDNISHSGRTEKHIEEDDVAITDSNCSDLGLIRKRELIVVGRKKLGDVIDLNALSLKYPDFRIRDIDLEQKTVEKKFRYSL